MDKSPEAFRTISEVAEALETPAHVLRFWESRFPQIKPVKRAGGRRYYRPADVALLSGIRHLLHDEGMTIRGVQKILREQGVRHVAGLAPDGAEVDFDAGDEGPLPVFGLPAEEPAGAEVVAFDAGRSERADPVPEGAGEVVPLWGDTPSAVSAAQGEFSLDDLPEVILHTALEDAGEPLLTAGLPADPLPDEAMQEPLPQEEVPEAGHVFVEMEDEPAEVSSPVCLFPETPAPAVVPSDAPPKLAGLAARIRALPRPLSPDVVPELMELHSRMGLLHAQMAEALRQRR